MSFLSHRWAAFLAVTFSLFEITTVRAVGPTNQKWSPLSTTASSITGTVTLAANQLTLANQKFPLTSMKEVDQAHLAAAAKIADMSEPPLSAKLYQTRILKTAKLLNANTICGPDQDAVWLLAVFGKGRLSLAFFSGSNPPELDQKAIANGHALCGTYGYVAATK